MKKLMLTTAIASVLTTAAIAQTTITGELRINYKAVGSEVVTGTVTTSGRGFGNEAQINVQTKGKLNVGGLDYAAGFALENDGVQATSLFNENTYMDFTNASSGTTISLSQDHIQRSDSDFSATNLVGFNNNELSQVRNGTNKGTFVNLGSLITDGSTSLDNTTEYKITFTPIKAITNTLGLLGIGSTDAVNKDGKQLKLKVN
jgi:hypothetical protein